MHGMQPTDRASLAITDARKPGALNYLLANCFSRLKSTIIGHIHHRLAMSSFRNRCDRRYVIKQVPCMIYIIANGVEMIVSP